MLADDDPSQSSSNDFCKIESRLDASEKRSLAGEHNWFRFGYEKGSPDQLIDFRRDS